MQMRVFLYVLVTAILFGTVCFISSYSIPLPDLYIFFICLIAYQINLIIYGIVLNLQNVDSLDYKSNCKSNYFKHKEPISEHIIKDRSYLLLLMAKSFKNAGKLILEKKHPNSKNVILVFQLWNGNLRFSISEDEVPVGILSNVIRKNTSKIDYNNNYRLIDENINEEMSKKQ